MNLSEPPQPRPPLKDSCRSTIYSLFYSGHIPSFPSLFKRLRLVSNDNDYIQNIHKYCTWHIHVDNLTTAISKRIGELAAEKGLLIARLETRKIVLSQR